MSPEGYITQWTSREGKATERQSCSGCSNWCQGVCILSLTYLCNISYFGHSIFIYCRRYSHYLLQWYFKFTLLILKVGWNGLFYGILWNTLSNNRWQYNATVASWISGLLHLNIIELKSNMSLLLCLCITQDFYHLGYKQLVPQRSINSRSQHSSWGSAIAQPNLFPKDTLMVFIIKTFPICILHI